MVKSIFLQPPRSQGDGGCNDEYHKISFPIFEDYHDENCHDGNKPHKD